MCVRSCARAATSWHGHADGHCSDATRRWIAATMPLPIAPCCQRGGREPAPNTIESAPSAIWAPCTDALGHGTPDLAIFFPRSLVKHARTRPPSPAPLRKPEPCRVQRSPAPSCPRAPASMRTCQWRGRAPGHPHMPPGKRCNDVTCHERDPQRRHMRQRSLQQTRHTVIAPIRPRR